MPRQLMRLLRKMGIRIKVKVNIKIEGRDRIAILSFIACVINIVRVPLQ